MHSTDPARPVVCAGCGCLCDDVGLVSDGTNIASAPNACDLGFAWLSKPRGLAARAWIAGQEVPLTVATHRAAEWLASAAAPAVQGLGGLTNEAVREAVLLATQLPAWLVPWPLPSLASERCGCDAPEFTASLGAVRGTADLIIYWQADPCSTHPRHVQRFAQGELVCNDRMRQIVLVDTAHSLSQNRTVSLSQQTVSLPELADPLEAAIFIVRSLHLQLRGNEAPLRDGDAPQAALELAHRIRRAGHTHVFLGETAAEHPLLASSWHALAAEARPWHHLTVSSLPRSGNERGVQEVLTALCGSPGAIDFPVERGPHAAGAEAPAPEWYPSLPGNPDACNPTGADRLVLVGASTPGNPAALATWSHIPRIVIDTLADPLAEVAFEIPGLDPRVQGTITRGDGVLLALCGAGASGLPDPAVTVLRGIRRALAARCGATSASRSAIA